ncbi:MAG: proline--tRNA ligase, partial [Armatimonadetes bacterium]|nr:proline--tRNA ligase [Armatimonadota bacterium]
LLGYPIRVVVGRKFKQEGVVEVRRRSDGEETVASPADIVAAVEGLST